MSFVGKLKRIITGERIDLRTGEVADGHLVLREQVSSIPMNPPIDYKREPTIFELVKQKMLQHQVEQLQKELGAESPEEAEDFDIDDPDYYNPSSPYEFERHEEELRESMEKLANFQRLMESKYPDRYPKKEEPTGDPKEGGAGGKPPAKGASSAVPKAPKGPSAAKPPSDDLDQTDEQDQ